MNLTANRNSYTASIMIFVLGMSILGYLVYYGWTHYNVEYQRIAAPGQYELNLQKAGTYTIFYEYYSVLNGKTYDNSKDNPELFYAVVDMSNGQQIRIKPVSGESSYESDDHAGRSMFEFDVSKPGKYQVDARYEAGKEGPEVVLAVGQDFILQIILCFLVGIILLTFTVGGAFWLLPLRPNNRTEQTGTSFRGRSMGPYIE